MKSDSPARPQAVVFDLGKVLLDFDYGIMARNLAAHSDASPQEVRTLLDQSPLLIRFETGLMTSDEFFEEVKRAINFRGGFREFLPLFGDIFTPIEPMVRLQADMRVAGVPTFIFSNTSALAVEHIRQAYEFFRQFTDYIYSFEQRAMKPDARIYEAVEERTGRRGPEILYMDDRRENVEAGAARGWRVIHHESEAVTVPQVRAMFGLAGS